MWIFWSEIFYGGTILRKGDKNILFGLKGGRLPIVPHWLKKDRQLMEGVDGSDSTIGQRDPRKVAMIVRSTEQKLYRHQNIVTIAHSA